MTAKAPRPPAGLVPAARRVWTSVVDVFDLDEHELALLRELVRVVDRLERLDVIVRAEGLIVDGGKAGPKAHPALVEARQLAIAQARLTVALRLPDGEELGGTAGRRQRRGGARGVYQMRSVAG